ncbi:uncharacterized protein LOC129766790 [Toxorhynchites rutilus septentrionalis]|uniref:uncharacterized protein LOC129766790 n=1 Tax=Toxorhynchites rutilus septentrionalis TaxID=329112 RepID=UPI002479582E|nr:uncharacterized protein LOC129766790 [Toxorhynchites rutilus septentrionalis]
MASNSTKFSGLLQRPYEPMFLPKSNGQLYYELPDNFLTDRYRPIGSALQNRFGMNVQTRIPLPNITPPDISFAQRVPRRGGFTMFNPVHRQVAGQLIQLFLDQSDPDSLCAVAAYCRDRLNAPMFQYALTVALQHRRDTADVPIPSFLQTFPDRYVDPSVFPQMQEEGRVVNQGNRMAIDIPMNYTASDREMEQRIAYWREDIGVNLHHWHWHLVYPSEGPDAVVRKDRRGELFYYLHQQTIARYNLERFCNGMSAVRPLAQLRDPIPEAYYPKIVQSSINRSYPGRGRNLVLRDLNRVEDQVFVTIAEMELWTGRIFEAIDAGFATSSSGERIPLDNKNGVDVLGNILEQSSLSPNVPYYGRLHIEGHMMLGYIHDPDNSFLEGFGVVGDNTTSMRDPVFYRWHKHIDDIFERHKRRFKPYNQNELSYSDIKIDDINVQLNRTGTKNNILLTFWQRSQIDLGTGFDFGPDGNIFATFTHLQHAPFSYSIKATNNGNAMRRGTARIFMGPKTDETGRNIPFREQRRMMIELDKFTVNLNPGQNTIMRRSDQSNVTIPYERTFRNVAASNQPNSAEFRFCNCGWPSHLLLPKGTPQGLKYDLFVMISNFNDDAVNQNFDDTVACDDAHSFCGLRDRLYPDARPMGYPFDRLFAPSVSSLKNFADSNSNMAVKEIEVRFTNTVISRYRARAIALSFVSFTMASNSTKFFGLLQRPYEPTFLPKSGGQVYFDLPANYLTDRYRPLGETLQNRFGSNVPTRIPLPNIPAPDINFAQTVSRRGGFSTFNREHMEVAGRLMELFLNQADTDTLCGVAAYCRDRLNGPLFQYALSVALQHRQDTTDVPIPSFLQLFPDRFVDPSIFPQMQEEGRIVAQGDRMAVDIPMNYTASEREPEQRLAYWREDIGVNLHHWHWHLVYPAAGPDSVVRKDRRGELFYYMHRQTMARYNIERYCNGLSKVLPLANLRDPIPEAYYPKIIRSSNNRSYPGRARNQLLSDLNRVEDRVMVTIADMELWTSRIFEAIDAGFAISTNGQRVQLENRIGIDIVGNMVENTTLSPNVNYYGRLHNEGHNMLGYIHDPDNSFLEGFGVVGDNTTAMRDPVFYRWHQHIDNIFERHKRRFKPYNKEELSHPDVEIDSFSVQLNRAGTKSNILLTFWQRSQVDLGTGLDFGPEGNVFATFTHIQHAPFTYRINVKNESSTNKRGTVRIFLGPKTDEKGNTIPFREQRLLMVEMDKFTVNLNPGDNNIVRRSEQSSVTIPYERTFRNIAPSNQATNAQFRFCNCGWPTHMLLPKGSLQGVVYDLFVMISNFNDDTVNQDFDENVACNDSHSYCGLRDRLYPDARNMGFPFDRVAQPSVSDLEDFVYPYGNMARAEVQIRFTNTVISRT